MFTGFAALCNFYKQLSGIVLQFSWRTFKALIWMLLLFFPSNHLNQTFQISVHLSDRLQLIFSAFLPPRPSSRPAADILSQEASVDCRWISWRFDASQVLCHVSAGFCFLFVKNMTLRYYSSYVDVVFGPAPSSALDWSSFLKGLKHCFMQSHCS